MTDFTSFTHAEIAAFLVAHQGDLGCHGITADYVNESLRTGQAILEARPYGFALIEPFRVRDESIVPDFWILFVDDEHRGAGLGRQFVKEILAKYAVGCPMSLTCYGARRGEFFERCGFRLESKVGELLHMTTNGVVR